MTRDLAQEPPRDPLPVRVPTKTTTKRNPASADFPPPELLARLLELIPNL
jgi:hypothetical protein